MYSTLAECRYVLYLVVLFYCMIIINTAQPVDLAPEPDIAITTDGYDDKIAKCSNCTSDSDHCKNIRLKMQNNFHTCDINNPCSCNCCGFNLECNPANNGLIHICEKNNGAPSAK